jgi:hypothetical protein
MHPPGYIQEGQETIFGYLLLGVYHRNSPGCTDLWIWIRINSVSDSLLQ